MNNYQWYSFRSKSSKPAGLYDVDAITTLAVQVEILGKKIDGLSVKQQVIMYPRMRYMEKAT
ncbi:hypothetical protein, partial [Vibrio vulnificus]